MFGLMTKAEHRRLMDLEAAKLDLSEFMRDHNADTARSHAQTIAALRAEIDGLQRQVDSYADRIETMQAEIDRLRPMADKWQAHLDRAQANFKKGK